MKIRVSAVLSLLALATLALPPTGAFGEERRGRAAATGTAAPRAAAPPSIPAAPRPHAPGQAALTLLASPVEVPPGGTATLSWNTSHADRCTASGGWTGPKALSGRFVTGTLAHDTSFFLTCVNAGYSVTRSMRITVTPAPLVPHPVDSLAPATWYAVPHSSFTQVCPPRPPYSVFTTCGTGLIPAWNGGAFDTARDRFLLWGGGHKGYGGNEMFAFDVRSLKWLRLTEPSVLIVDEPNRTAWFPGNEPVSAHTYDGIEYVPSVDRLLVTGVSPLIPYGTLDKSMSFPLYRFANGSTTWARYFDLRTRQWGPPLTKAVTASGGSMPVMAAYDPIRNKVYSGGNHGSFDEFDVATSTWKYVGNIKWNYLGAYPYDFNGTFDPKRRLFLAIGNGRLFVYNTYKGVGFMEVLRTTGATEILFRRVPGFAYSSKADRFVAWAGGADVYVLDPNGWVWTKISPAASNRFVPPAQDRNGTFGRFRYVASKDAFMVVNEAVGNVYFYRLPALSGDRR
jgi:hypothetical protein